MNKMASDLAEINLSFPATIERHNTILEELEKLNYADLIYLDFPRTFNKIQHGLF